MATEHRPKLSDREQATQALIAAIFVALPALALDTCGTVMFARAKAAPREVTVAELSDRQHLPAGTSVRVHAEIRPRTVTTTSRGNRMLALADCPDVVVFCRDGQAECEGAPPLAREIVGEIEEAKDEATGKAALDQFLKGTLHVDRERARILDTRVNAEAGTLQATIAFAFGGVLTLAVLAMLLRVWQLRVRARQKEAIAGSR